MRRWRNAQKQMVFVVSIPYRCNETLTKVSKKIFLRYVSIPYRCNETLFGLALVATLVGFQFLIGAMRLKSFNCQIKFYNLFQFLIGAMRQ